MRTLFRLFVIVPIAIVLLMFAFANRHLVTVSFDPFAGNDIAGPAIRAPLFIVLILSVGVGVNVLVAVGIAVFVALGVVVFVLVAVGV